MDSQYRLPGEFEYEGMVLTNKLTSVKLMDGARQLTLNPTDTIVAAYHKSGNLL